MKIANSRKKPFQKRHFYSKIPFFGTQIKRIGMNRILSLLIIGTLPLLSNAQELSISTAPGSNVTLEASINGSGIQILEMDGTEIFGADYSVSANDPSIAVYPLADGSFIVRENIANFLVYDSFGKVQRSISNSTQSEGGEAISELAMDGNGKTVVVYNPKVMTNGVEGSRGKIISGSGPVMDVFYSQDRALSHVEVSANGEFIAFVSAKEGSDDEVQLMDRFGNMLVTISFDQSVKGVSFSENGLYVAIYSGGRAAAYQVRSGERVGSTSFRNTSVVFAGYDPVDKTIIGLTGSGSSTLTEVQLHAVNVSARKIARENSNESFNIVSQVSMERVGSGRYKIKGLDKEITLRASF